MERWLCCIEDDGKICLENTGTGEKKELSDITETGIKSLFGGYAVEEIALAGNMNVNGSLHKGEKGFLFDMEKADGEMTTGYTERTADVTDRGISLTDITGSVMECLERELAYKEMEYIPTEQLLLFRIHNKNYDRLGNIFSVCVDGICFRLQVAVDINNVNSVYITGVNIQEGLM